MYWFRGVGVWAMVTWLAASAGCIDAAENELQPDEAKTVVIPLDQIWALDMPGTRDVRSLKPKEVTWSIGSQIGWGNSSSSGSKKKIAGPGFAARGTGMEALIAAHAELPEGQKPPDTFPFGSKLSVVFFSHGFNYYVHLNRVERLGNVITIRYRFVPHETKNLSSHFAIIPVSDLQHGEVQVNIVRSPMEEKYIDGGFKPVNAEWERRVVCKSFSFSISESE